MMDSLYEVTKRNGAGRTLCGSRRPLRVITYLAPNLFWFYEFVSRYLAKRLRYPTEISVESDYARLPERADLAFICGLPYVEHARLEGPCFEPLVAPVLQGERYGGKPIYFSDVIVRRDSSFHRFADLRGRSWAYNEPHSQSGYGIVRYHLVQKGETSGYFSRVVEAGFHERAVRMVHSGEADASAIDSHVLAIMLRDDPGLAGRLRVIDTFGPSPIQPIVAGSHLSKSLKGDVKNVLLELGDDQTAKHHLACALVDRFVPVSDVTYEDIRRMHTIAQAARFLTIQ